MQQCSIFPAFRDRQVDVVICSYRGKCFGGEHKLEAKISEHWFINSEQEELSFSLYQEGKLHSGKSQEKAKNKRLKNNKNKGIIKT